MLVAERPTPKHTPSPDSIRLGQHQPLGSPFSWVTFRVKPEVRERRGRNSGPLLRLGRHI